MKIFVTGGAGFIGSNFIHELLTTTDYSVVNYDKLTYAGNLLNLEAISGSPKYQFLHGDICDRAGVERGMAGCDTVVHFAAESHVDRSIYSPSAAIETNYNGTFTLLEVARSLGVAKFVHVSTDEVYGDLEKGAVATEASSIKPSSPYSASKAASDLLVLSYVRTYGFPGVVTRASNNYGPYQFPEKFVPLMITNAIAGRKLPVYGDGLQERDWLHVSDHCRAVLAVLDRGRIGEVYNIGGGNVTTNIHMVRQILAELKCDEGLIEYVIDRPGHDRRYALDHGKISQELGWIPKISIDSGLSETVKWYREHSDWVQSVRSGEYLKYYETYYVNRETTLRAAETRGEK